VTLATCAFQTWDLGLGAFDLSDWVFEIRNLEQGDWVRHRFLLTTSGLGGPDLGLCVWASLRFETWSQVTG
jgi:hypothetical protein